MFEVIKMAEMINFAIDSKDIQTFEEKTGLKFADGMKLLMDNLKYGGNFGLDPFWSEENQKRLKESISDLEEGKSIMFTAEEWEKFANAQEI